VVRRLLPSAVVVLAFGLVLAPVAASAHVTVNPREASPGGFAKLSFRMPNERPDASSTQLEVTFPEAHPIRSVSVRPVPGWEVQIERRTLDTPITTDDGEVTEVVSKITWSGGPVNPGEFQEFDVSVGPLPTDADALVFPAIQTYDSGEVVRWIETPEEGTEELEHPAPVLTLVSADDDTDDGAGAGAGGGTGEIAAGDTGGDDGTDALSIVALVIAVVALAVAGLGAARARRP
jgi:uncharacterized protein YcnI